MKLTEEQLIAIKAQHEGTTLHVIDCDDFNIVVKTPATFVLEGFINTVDRDKAKALKTLLKSIFIDGDKSALTDIGKILSIAEHLDVLIGLKKTSLTTL